MTVELGWFLETEMADATRSEALNWCRDKMCDFKTPVYPPPSGWMWAESGDALVLAPIFTMTDQGDEISSVEAEQVMQ